MRRISECILSVLHVMVICTGLLDIENNIIVFFLNSGIDSEASSFFFFFFFLQPWIHTLSRLVGLKASDMRETYCSHWTIKCTLETWKNTLVKQILEKPQLLGSFWSACTIVHKPTYIPDINRCLVSDSQLAPVRRLIRGLTVPV